MYNPEMRKDCPMRGNLGNCSPVGGFCMNAVSNEICEAVHNAYNHGFYNAVRMLKKQETVPVYEDKINKCECGETVCRYWHPKFCGFCGRKLLWY